MTAQLTPRVTEAFATGVIAYLKQENKVSERLPYERKKRRHRGDPENLNWRPNERHLAPPVHSQSRKSKQPPYPPATARYLVDASLVNPNNNGKLPKFSRPSTENKRGYRSLKSPFSNAETSIGEGRKWGWGPNISPHSRISPRARFVAEKNVPSTSTRRFCINRAPSH